MIEWITFGVPSHLTHPICDTLRSRIGHWSGKGEKLARADERGSIREAEVERTLCRCWPTAPSEGQDSKNCAQLSHVVLSPQRTLKASTPTRSRADSIVAAMWEAHHPANLKSQKSVGTSKATQTINCQPGSHSFFFLWKECFPQKPWLKKKKKAISSKANTCLSWSSSYRRAIFSFCFRERSSSGKKAKPAVLGAHNTLLSCSTLCDRYLFLSTNVSLICEFNTMRKASPSTAWDSEGY